MVELHVRSQSSSLDEVFRALADPTRRDMLRRLSSQDRSVGELAEPFDMSLAAASKHIRVLESAGLVHREIQGRRHLCSLSAAPMAGVQEWLKFYEKFWNRRLDGLEALLKADDATAVEKKKPRKRRSRP